MSRYRYRNHDNTIGLLILLIGVIAGIILGVKYKDNITLFVTKTYNEFVRDSEDYISLDEAEDFFYRNRPTFEEYVEATTENTLYLDNTYISIIDRFDFGGKRIRAFRFQNTADIGAEIIYSKETEDLQESSVLRKLERHWYVYNYVNS